MWEVTVQGETDQVYKLLKAEFDEKCVEKEEIEGTKERAVVDDSTSLQFRYALKGVQSMLGLYSGKVKVTLFGVPGKSVDIRIEAT